MTYQQIPSAQELTLYHVAALQTAIKADVVEACYGFGITFDQAQLVASLDSADIQRVITALGPQCAFRLSEAFWDAVRAHCALPIVREPAAA